MFMTHMCIINGQHLIDVSFLSGAACSFVVWCKREVCLVDRETVLFFWELIVL